MNPINKHKMLTPKEVDSENKTFSKIRIIFVNTAASWVLSPESWVVRKLNHQGRTREQKSKDKRTLKNWPRKGRRTCPIPVTSLISQSLRCPIKENKDRCFPIWIPESSCQSELAHKRRRLACWMEKPIPNCATLDRICASLYLVSSLCGQIFLSLSFFFFLVKR
jgi:hypothetical protein